MDPYCLFSMFFNVNKKLIKPDSCSIEMIFIVKPKGLCVLSGVIRCFIYRFLNSSFISQIALSFKINIGENVLGHKNLYLICVICGTNKTKTQV